VGEHSICVRGDADGLLRNLRIFVAGFVASSEYLLISSTKNAGSSLIRRWRVVSRPSKSRADA
jgi:hypothetical protein